MTEIRNLAQNSRISMRMTSKVGGTTVAGYTSSLAISGNKLQLTAIPEPATYAVIFGGVSLLGTAIYRRRGD